MCPAEMVNIEDLNSNMFFSLELEITVDQFSKAVQ